MSLVLGSTPGDAASHAGRLGADALPDDAMPQAQSWVTAPDPAAFSHLAPCRECGAMNGVSASECWRCEADLSIADALLDVMSRTAAPRPAPEPVLPDVSHLAPCRHCGAMNGLSALDCWQCEARLSAEEPIGAEAVQPEDEAPGPISTFGPAPFAHSASMVPVLNSPALGHLPQMSRSVSSAIVVRRRRMVVATIALASMLGVAGALAWRAWFEEAPGASLVSERATASVGIAAMPVSDAPPMARPAPVVPDSTARAESPSPDASAEAVGRRVSAMAQPRPRRQAATVASAETRRGAARDASRSAAAAVTGEAPTPAPPEAARPAAVSPRECTATVAALGLCAAAPTQPKE